MSKDNIRAYFRAEWRLLCLLSFKSFFATSTVLKIRECSRIIFNMLAFRYRLCHFSPGPVRILCFTAIASPVVPCVASYADSLWARHAISPPPPPPPPYPLERILKPRQHSLPFVCSHPDEGCKLVYPKDRLKITWKLFKSQSVPGYCEI